MWGRGVVVMLFRILFVVKSSFGFSENELGGGDIFFIDHDTDAATGEVDGGLSGEFFGHVRGDLICLEDGFEEHGLGRI